MFTTYMALGTMISQTDPVFTIGAGAVVAMTGLFALALAGALGALAELRGRRFSAGSPSTGDRFASTAAPLAA